MIDYILGRPSSRIKRLEYNRQFFRATWIVTALDAGFWTAMNMKPKFLKDIMSLIFTLYYLVNPEEAEEKVRRYRSVITVEMMRISWEKPMHPFFRLIEKTVGPRFSISKRISIPRPQKEPHDEDPIWVHIYYSGPPDQYKISDGFILNIPGGGFVSMPPKCHESYYRIWASETSLPIISIDYGKAPECPYPYAIEECFDLYRMVVETQGGCLGFSNGIRETHMQSQGKDFNQLNIVVTADSAGANIAVGMMFSILESKARLPRPKGLVLIYPCLDFNISSWMTPTQANLFKAQSVSCLNSLNESKSHFTHSSPLSTVNDTGVFVASLSAPSTGGPSKLVRKKNKHLLSIAERVKKQSTDSLTKLNKCMNDEKYSELTMTSRMSYFADRIISPDLMRAMAILYLSPPNYPDFNSDYYLSPIVAPESLLQLLPNLLIVCGERDPLVDDTILFASRVRQAKVKGLNKFKKSPEYKMKKFKGLTPISNLNSQQNNKGDYFASKGKGFTIGSDGFDTEDSDEDTSSSNKKKALEIEDKKFSKHDVEVKIFSGMSHGFLIMTPFLPEAINSVKFLSSRIKLIMDQQ